MAEMIRKITARTVGCEGKLGESFTVIGAVYRTDEGKSDFGPFIRFGGMFEAMNEQTGELFRSAILIIPKVVEDILMSAFQAAKGDVEDHNANVKIAVRFKTIKNTGKRPGGTEYVWAAEMLKDPVTVDPLADVRQYLPAPTGTNADMASAKQEKSKA